MLKLQWTNGSDKYHKINKFKIISFHYILTRTLIPFFSYSWIVANIPANLRYHFPKKMWKNIWLSLSYRMLLIWGQLKFEKKAHVISLINLNLVSSRLAHLERIFKCGIPPLKFIFAGAIAMSIKNVNFIIVDFMNGCNQRAFCSDSYLQHS